MRELHPSCTTQVYGTMQALYLAQVCSLRTDISLCGTRLHEGQHRLRPRGYWLVRLPGVCSRPVLIARLRSAPACSNARVTSTGQASLLYACATGSPTQFHAPTLRREGRADYNPINTTEHRVYRRRVLKEAQEGHLW
jgi:hypothetical protein